MPEQFQVIDTNWYYRTGGIDYPKMASFTKHIILQACAGSKVNPILQEQIEGVKRAGQNYETFGIPDANIDPVYWADFYMDIPGVMDHPKWMDVEPNLGKMINQYQGKKIKDRINSKSDGPAGYYSNYGYTLDLGNPAWIRDMEVWWAEYPYHWDGIKYVKYKYFHQFHKERPMWSGKWSAKLGISPILLQFTDNGDAVFYGANERTADPDWPIGKKSADLNLGLIPYEDYLVKRFSPYSPAGPPGTIIDYILATLADHEDRITNLEK